MISVGKVVNRYIIYVKYIYIMSNPTSKMIGRINMVYKLLNMGGFDIINSKGEVCCSLDLPFKMNELDTNVMKLAVIMFSLNYGLEYEPSGEMNIKSDKLEISFNKNSIKSLLASVQYGGDDSDDDTDGAIIEVPGNTDTTSSIALNNKLSLKTRVKVTILNFNKLIWVISTMLLLYFTTHIGLAISRDSIKTKMDIINIQQQSLKRELSRPMPEKVKTLLEYINLYNPVEASTAYCVGDKCNINMSNELSTNVYENDMELYRQLLEKYVESNNNQLYIAPPQSIKPNEEPKPEEIQSTWDFVMMSCWNGPSKLIDNMLKPYTDVRDELVDIGTSKATELQGIKQVLEQVTGTLASDLDKLNAMARQEGEKPINTVLNNLYDMLLQRTQESKIGNVRKKIAIAQEIIVLIPEVMTQLAVSTPNVPSEIVKIVSNYQSVITEFMWLYWVIGLINSLYMTIIGYLLSQVKIRKEDMSEEDFIELKRQFLLKYQEDMKSIILKVANEQSLSEDDIANSLGNLIDIVNNIDMPENMKFNKDDFKTQINSLFIRQFGNGNLANNMRITPNLDFISRFIVEVINNDADNQQQLVVRGGKSKKTKKSTRKKTRKTKKANRNKNKRRKRSA